MSLLEIVFPRKYRGVRFFFEPCAFIARFAASVRYRPRYVPANIIRYTIIYSADRCGAMPFARRSLRAMGASILRCLVRPDVYKKTGIGVWVTCAAGGLAVSNLLRLTRNGRVAHCG